MLSMKDARGTNSKTLFFVHMAFVIGTVAFIYAVITSGAADLVEYGAFVTTILVPWLYRETISKGKENVQ